MYVIAVNQLIVNKQTNNTTVWVSKMHTKRTRQMSIHETCAEPQNRMGIESHFRLAGSAIDVLDWAEQDIQRKGIRDTGCNGMTIGLILRCGLLKQHQQWTYEDLSFYLSDSATSATFARLPQGLYPTDPALQSAVALISGQTGECISHALVKDALTNRIETVKQARIDSALTETLIHKPWGSQLLGDAERVLERLVTEPASGTGSYGIPAAAE